MFDENNDTFQEPAPEPKSHKPKSPKVLEMPLHEVEREKYEHVWRFPEYRVGSPGLRSLPDFFAKTGAQPRDTVIDVGCGMGKAALQMRERGLRVTMFDIADNCLNPEVREALVPGFLDFKTGCIWDVTPADLEPADFVFCCDVLEHIPTEQVPNTLNVLRYLTNRQAYLRIALFDDTHYANVTGRQLHLTVKTPRWWEEQLHKYFNVEHQQELVNSMTVLVTPKPEV